MGRSCFGRTLDSNMFALNTSNTIRKIQKLVITLGYNSSLGMGIYSSDKYDQMLSETSSSICPIIKCKDNCLKVIPVPYF